MNTYQALPLVLMGALALGGCDGGGGSASTIANGGIGGTSAGTVTGLSADTVIASRAATPKTLEINDSRQFTLAGDTAVLLDDDTASVSDIVQGMQVDVDLRDDANALLTRGTLQRVFVESTVKGPVTGVNPLQVLRQPITTSDSTRFANGLDVNTLVVGDIVEIHGLREDTAIRASFIRMATNTPHWRLTGTVTNLNAGRFTIGTQEVQVGSAELRRCGTGLANNVRVRVRATREDIFTDGDALDTVTRIDCRLGPRVPEGFSGDTLGAGYEGFIDSVPSATTFTIDGQTVSWSSTTEFERGAPVDLVTGARVEAEGRFNLTSGVLEATTIEFREARFRIEGPVSAIDSTAGTLTVFGITVRKGPLIRDEANVFGGSVTLPRQVAIVGFIDRSGSLLARSVRLANTDSRRYEVRGPITAETPPLFSLLGINVDTSTATFGDDDQVGDDRRRGEDDSSAPLSATDFFQRAQPGYPVKVSGGTYNAGSNTVSGAHIELDD